eukprot:1303933-Prorocentrum_lima.AAC.1
MFAAMVCITPEITGKLQLNGSLAAGNSFHDGRIDAPCVLRTAGKQQPQRHQHPGETTYAADGDACDGS